MLPFAVEIPTEALVGLLVAILGPGGFYGARMAYRATGRQQGDSISVKTANEALQLARGEMLHMAERLEQQRQDFERRIHEAIDAERRECDEKISDLERRHRSEIDALNTRISSLTVDS